jgi:acyl carrier protein
MRDVEIALPLKGLFYYTLIRPRKKGGCRNEDYMDAATIEEKLKKMIVDRLFLQVPAEEIETDASLVQTYGVDSVCLLELVVGLEEAFGIHIEDSDFDVKNFSSVAALRDFVMARL